MPWGVREVREDDAPAIVDLLNAIIARGTMTTLTTPFTVDDQVRYIRSMAASGVYHAAICNESGAVRGVQGIEPLSSESALAHVGDISTFIALGFLRRGVGRVLNRATESAAMGLGLRKLMATVRADNPAARSYYAAVGYQLVGTARDHARIGGRFVDAIILEKALTEHRTRE
jgi:L-amino acid N-acyltransferase YncA